MSDALTDMARAAEAEAQIPAIARAWRCDRELARYRRAMATLEEDRDFWLTRAIDAGQTEYAARCGTVRIDPDPDGRSRFRFERYPDPPPACEEAEA